MKEKTIEKIPYLGLQKISRKKSVKYIGVTAVKIIGHKKHLLLEVYENKKESKKIPVVRIALTKKDFGTYWPDKHVWTRQQVSYYRPIWMETHTGGTLTDENILQSPEDLERIKTFCGTKLFNPSWWWEHISRYEADITSTERINRVEREHKRRQEALKDRQANTKALPEKAILYRADHVYFHDEHFLYYKKHGSRADIACSKCGGVTTARWKSSGAYEDQFERNIEEPRENSFGTCPMLFEDLNPDSPTFGAMCLGSMGFEIASKRTADGKDWIWSTFGTGKGFFADYIIAGTMLADRIYGGTLTIGGIDNIAGIIKVLDGNGAILTIMDKDGILTNGKYTCGSDEFGRRVEISEGEMKIMDKSGNTVGRIFAVSNEIFKIGTENALFRMFKTGEVYVDCQSFGVNGYNGFTGTVEYSDGTYENYVGGLLIGGKSKEGAYP